MTKEQYALAVLEGFCNLLREHIESPLPRVNFIAGRIAAHNALVSLIEAGDTALSYRIVEDLKS